MKFLAVSLSICRLNIQLNCRSAPFQANVAYFCCRMLLLTILLASSFSYSLVTKLASQNINGRVCNNLGIKMASQEIVLDGFSKLFDRSFRPALIGIPRRRLELSFAVQLMRSSYNSVDLLDFVPMDEFQRSFFLFRQSEWEDYKNYHKNIMQGDLADPLYFDFISFAQYSVIADKMRNAKSSFVEKVGAEGELKTVSRSPSIVTSELPLLHSKMVGNYVLE